jgi:hypothetical protein
VTDEVRPWADLTPEFAAAVTREDFAEEMTEEIHRRIPEYARRWDDAFADVIRTAIERVMEEVLLRIADPTAPHEPAAEFFRSVGRSVAKEGRDADTLQKAVRVAGLAVWRRVARDADRLRLSARSLGLLGEIVMMFQDEVAGAAAEGYAQTQAVVAGELTRRRSQLMKLLLTEPPATAEDIASLARLARWPVPRAVAAVALHEHHVDVARPSLPPDILLDLSRTKPCLIVPDPEGPGRSRLLDGALGGWLAAIGPTVPLAEVSRSLRWAYQGLGLARRGVIPGHGAVRCADHMSTLVLFQDEELLASMAARLLAPLSHLRAGQQDRLAETLLAWLQSGRNTNGVALRLHVHPQTVRYRLRQLEDLFGDRLQDRDLRFELEIALRARTLLAGPEAVGLPTRTSM